MPGNVKLGFSNEPDPDPTPYLYVSADIKRMDSHKPYDPKKSVWIPEENGGFAEGTLQLFNRIWHGVGAGLGGGYIP